MRVAGWDHEWGMGWEVGQAAEGVAGSGGCGRERWVEQGVVGDKELWVKQGAGGGTGSGG